MRTFADSAGRQWKVELTLGAAKRIQALTGVNLLELDRGDPPLLTRLGLDVMLLCDVIFAVLEPQAEAAGVSDEQFGEALGGEAILAARTAFFEELADFFRRLGRADLARAIPAQEKLLAVAVERADRRIGEVDVEQAARQIVGDRSLSLQASSESTPSP